MRSFKMLTTSCGFPLRFVLGCIAAYAFVHTLVRPDRAAAQSGSYYDRNNNVSVLGRPRPDYDPIGLLYDSFLISPAVTIQADYDDNIFVTNTGKTPDEILSIAPSINITSEWSRNQVAAFAQATSNSYVKDGSQGTLDYALGASGRYDTYQQSNFAGAFNFSQTTLARSAEATLGSTIDPIQVASLGLSGSGLQTINRVRFSETLGFSRVTYSNGIDFSGAPVLFTQLDNNVITLSGRADYAVNPDIALFISTVVNSRDYDLRPPQTPLDRNSSGIEPTFGADFDITRLVRGQVQVGYLEQNYQSTTFHQVAGPAAQMAVEYFPSGLTTITVNFNRAVLDAVDPNAISYLQTAESVQLDHELLRNLILSGRAGYETDVFSGEDRHDQRPTASFTATYLLNRALQISANYSYLDENSTGSAKIGSYRVNTFYISLTYHK